MEQLLILMQMSTHWKNIVDTSTQYATLRLARANSVESNPIVYFSSPQVERCKFEFANNLKWLSESHKVLHTIPHKLYDKHLWDLSTCDVGCLHNALMLFYFNLEVLHGHRNAKKLSLRLPQSASH